ncbi:hypothetical protein AB0K12_04875 [Nonomuraea sp. NPDC049419]|uniref:hypothetical protein n=1 Tax=Nonomuraea sp. NPDC049419 TaxID=3155772 RepID=UPI003415870F
MLPLSLGVAWLVLGPLALWLLVRGTTIDRAAAVVTLVLLEAGTVAMSALRPPPAPAADPSPQAVAVAATPAEPSCRGRAPVPRTADVSRHLVLTWPAVPGECRTAEVVVLPRGKKLLIWLYAAGHPGRAPSRHSYTRPVHVKDGTASLTVPLHPETGVVPVDGRSGRPIPSRPA